MRFKIEIGEKGEQRISCPDAVSADGTTALYGWKDVVRTITKGPYGQRWFPLPPEAEVQGLPPGEPHGRWCAGEDLETLAGIPECLSQRFNATEAVDLGRYLFHVLIGSDAWQQILEAAQAARASLIELALSWPCSERDLHDLNWEMMHGPDGFLVAGGSRPGSKPGTPWKYRVSVIRLMNGAGTAPRKVAMPPRILFVVGTSVHEAAIRPGSEVLGLLEHLERNEITVQSCVVQQATPQQVADMIRFFCPDVVHFICHGDVDSLKGGYLELQPDRPDQESRQFADDLLRMLGQSDDFAGPADTPDAGPTALPPIVLLSACCSAGNGGKAVMGGPVTVPLAAELSAGGVPIVIGMAGRIADTACRFFTRSFGTSLVGGRPLIDAFAEARQAAFRASLGPNKMIASVDWAFPALFMSHVVGADYVPAPASGQEQAKKLAARTRVYYQRREPVFCDRHEFCQAYYSMFRTDRQPVVAIKAKDTRPGYGRTRLLEEFTAKAIRDGHVPCLVSSPDEHWTPPTSPVELGMEIARAVATARVAFELDPATPDNSVMLRLLLDACPQPPGIVANPALLLAALLRTRAGGGPLAAGVPGLGISEEVVKTAIRQDLVALLKETRRKHQYVDRADGQLLLLLDDVHNYDKALDFLLYRLLGEYGVGESQKDIIRVVMVFSSYTAASQWLEPFLDSGKKWLTRLELGAFREETDEDMLAYGRVLLHPFTSKLKPLVFDEDHPDFKEYQGVLRAALRGIPQNLTSPELGVFLKMACIAQALKEADDEERMKDLLGKP